MPQKWSFFALNLHKNNANIIGTDPDKIDNCEDRDRYSSMLDNIGIKQPEWKSFFQLEAINEESRYNKCESQRIGPRSVKTY